MFKFSLFHDFLAQNCVIFQLYLLSLRRKIARVCCPDGGMVDTEDLKSSGHKRLCGFESRSGYSKLQNRLRFWSFFVPPTRHIYQSIRDL